MGRWASDVWAGTVSGTISGVISAAVVLVLASTVFSNRIAERALTANPTCG